MQESAESTSSDVVSQAFDEAMYGAGLRIALGPLGFLAKSKKWLASCRRAQSFAEAYVDKALGYSQSIKSGDEAIRNESKHILLYNLATHLDDKMELRDAVLQAFFVSQGTTAVCTSNVLFLVSRKPAVWARLREEVLLSVGDSEAPKYYQLQRMTYLRRVMDEGGLTRILSILTCVLTRSSSAIISRATTVEPGCPQRHHPTNRWRS